MIANARMYAVNAEVAAQWSAVLHWVADAARVPFEIVAHAPPASLDTLWRRPDLGSAFMCGYPWTQWDAAATRPHMLAAVVPSPARYGGASVYCTDIVARADAGVATLDALSTARFAYTTPTSQSGYQAVRAFFASRAHAAGGHAFAAVVGPLVTPRAVVDAVLAGAADAGPLDSYWHDLLRRHEPATAAHLATLASTPPTPAPPIVCAAALAPALRERLAGVWLAAGEAPALATARAALLIARFVRPDPAVYRSLTDLAHAADALGYRTLQ